MIEFLSEMTALDAILILLWLLAIIFGATGGFIRQVFVLVATVVGIMVGYFGAPTAALGTGLVTGLGPQRALAPTYSILVIAVAAVFYVLAHRVYPVTRLAGRAIIDGVGGTLLGFAVGLLGVMELVAMFKFMTEGPWTFFDGMRVAIRAQIESTPFLPLIAQTFQVMQAFVDSFIPPH